MKLFRKTRKKIADDFVADVTHGVTKEVKKKAEPIQEIIIPLASSATALIPLIAIVGSLKPTKVIQESSKIAETVNVFIYYNER